MYPTVEGRAMLTSDLVRFQTDGDRVLPRYIKRNRASRYLADAEKLIQLIKDHMGRSQKELAHAFLAYEGERTDFKIVRGLCKLLLEQVEFAPEESVDYVRFRHDVFTQVQACYPVLTHKDLIHSETRYDILSKIAARLNLTPDEVDRRLYGDLPENQILTSCDITWNQSDLIRRYNLALAQGLLYRSQRMIIRLRSDFRLVFQYLKLARLMHWIRPMESGGYEIIVNGPGSLLTQTQRYGVRMAMFLPGLVLAKDWDMVAEINLHDEIKYFCLDHHCGLTSHYKGLSAFDSDIEKNFYDKFSRKDRKWAIEREGSLIDLGNTVFIPDFTFRHEDGRIAYMEIVGYWTPEYLEKKIEKLNQFQGNNLILAVNSQLNCGRGDFKASVIFYRTGIKLADVLDALEKIS